MSDHVEPDRTIPRKDSGRGDGAAAPEGKEQAARVVDDMLRAYGPILLVALGTAAHVAYYFPRVVDDLFISLRYAENLAHGLGAVYNPGERVEGYSGPLWMLLQSVGFLLHVDGVTWTKLLALASLAATEYGLYRLARGGFGIEGWLAWVPSLFCAANSYVVNWTVLGLETPLHLAAIVLCPVAIDAALASPSARTRGWAIASLLLLATTRPESMLYVAVNLAAPLVVARSRGELLAQGRKLAAVAVPALAAIGVLLLVRRAYYGHFVPNTYFVKGSHLSFDLGKLAALWSQGAGTTEAVVWLGGAVLLFVFGWRRRKMAPALSVLACAYFTASVIEDWMPSLRHLLPITLLAPLGWVALVDALARRHDAKAPRLDGLSLAALALLVHAAYTLAQIDNRNSPEENRNGSWIRPKTKEKWADTKLAYRRREPPHVARMGTYEMGQISQCWGILEASAEPVEDSWFVGRDIGAVGYFTGVRVFDTAGLFTPAVSMSKEWTDHHRVSEEAVQTMMALRPLGGEIYEGWELALGARRELLRGYRIRFGSMQRPYAFVAADRPKPDRAEVLRRYTAMAARFPRLYHLHTLYGESVGAVMERRLRVVRAELGER
jgi:hypothetical protein